MKTVNIAVCNLAKTPIGVDVHKLVQACQKQVSRDFAPAWSVDANLFLVDDYTDDYWILLLLDDADQADALGYHDVTAKGHPIGKVFVRTTVNDGEQPTVTLSHELLEMLGDPDIQQTARDPQTGWVYAYEACDAVQSQSYLIDGVKVSNFVTRAYFDRAAPAGTKRDFLGRLSEPFSLGHGGYMPVDKGQGWTQIFGSVAAEVLYNAQAHHRVPRILHGQLRSFTVNETQMQAHPVMAMGFNWNDIKAAVAKFGPQVLDLAQALVTKGFSVQWVTQTMQTAVNIIEMPSVPTTAALQPGVQVGASNVLGGIIQQLIQSLLTNVNWQDLISKLIAALVANLGTVGTKPTAGALPVAE